MNLIDSAAADPDCETADTLLETSALRLERIVSLGQTSPAGFWYDQERAEWVMLVAGAARLRFEDEPADRILKAGDCTLISAHRRHRVSWTDPDRPTIWLALHFDETGKTP